VTLTAGNTSGIPVLGATYTLGATLANTPGLVMRVKANSLRSTETTFNVLAELPGDDTNVVMLGAHLDSVIEGPGINDNGSGSAAILEVAEQMRRVQPENTVRFAWWGAEESGLVGSTHYVGGLTNEEIDGIALYLNFDMIGSPNYVRAVYDGDGSTFGTAGPAGSGAIEDLFTGFYSRRSLASEPALVSGRSDYAPFSLAGIPFGGLFTGAEGIKTAGEAALWGGTAGIAYDPCYHQACDAYANVNLHALAVNADGVAYATLSYGMNTSDVNGVSGKGNFKLKHPLEPLPSQLATA
jgi:Zn-dependent M28 family amino/carboxypeptidase